MSIKLDTIEWARQSTENCARSLNLTIRTNGICTTQNLSYKMRRTNFTGILRYKRITYLGQTTKPSYSRQKNDITCRTVDFAVPSDHGVKPKESEKRDKYQDFARELKIYGT